MINDQLREAAKRHGLNFAPDPATHQFCTLGGNIGNNSCGAHTVMGGKTVDNVEALEILTYDGEHIHVGATALEGFQDTVVSHMRQKGKHLPGVRFLPDGRAWLLVEFGGESQTEANDRVEKAYRQLRRIGTRAIEMRLVEKPQDQSEVWDNRESGVGSSRVE